MNKFADFMDRFLFYKSKGFSFKIAKEKAIAEMLAFGIIKSEEEIERDREIYQRHRLKIYI